MENIIGNLIRKRRIELKLTLKQVASSCDVSESTVSRWETGEIDNIKRGTIYLLSKVLYLPIETILGIECDIEIESAEIINERQNLISKINKIKNIDDIKNINKYICAFIEK